MRKYTPTDYRIEMAYRILERTKEGRMIEPERPYGDGRIFPCQYATEELAIEAAVRHVTELDCYVDYLIVPVLNKRVDV